MWPCNVLHSTHSCATARQHILHNSTSSAQSTRHASTKTPPCTLTPRLPGPQEQSRLFGRHFDEHDELVSRISRESINALKNHFRDELGTEDWRLVVKLKKVFGIT